MNRPSSTHWNSTLYAKDIMNADAVPLTPGKFDRDLVVQFLSGLYDGWPVVDPNRKVIGVVRELRLLEALSEGAGGAIQVEDAMTTPPFYVFEEDPLIMVLDLMVRKQVLRMSVVGERSLVGVISRDNILRQFLLPGEEASRLISLCPWCERAQEPQDSQFAGNDRLDLTALLAKEQLKFTDVDLSHSYCPNCLKHFRSIVPEVTGTPSRQRPQEKRRLSILVVDDDPTVGNMLAEMLQKLGYEVWLAGNGRDGLKLVVSREVDGILLDLHMPIMNGRTMLDELRWSGYEIPVVMMSGGADQKELRQFIHEGAQGFLMKPFPFSTLKKTCEDLFSQKGSQERSSHRLEVA